MTRRRFAVDAVEAVAAVADLFLLRLADRSLAAGVVGNRQLEDN